MSSCKHINLALLPAKKNLVRCSHCHLTIKSDDLGKGHCPECYEMHNKKLFDFEEVEAEETVIARYRCETCGIIIESDNN